MLSFVQVGGTTGLQLAIDQECAYGSSSPVIMIVIGVIAGLIVLTCLGTVWYYCRKAAAYRQRHPYTDDDQCEHSSKLCRLATGSHLMP